MYKKQIQELHEQMLNDEMKSKKLEYEYKSVEEKCNILKSEKERMQLEYERLKESFDKINSNSTLFEESGNDGMIISQNLSTYLLVFSKKKI